MIVKSKLFNKTYNLNQAQLIGEGNFAQVYKIFDTDLNKFLAIRRVAKQDAEPEDLLKQKKINQQLQKVKNPNILEIYEIIDHKDLVWYLTQYCEGGSLWDALNEVKNHKFTEVETLECVLQIAKGIQELHNHRITHRDLKPQNILLKKKFKRGGQIPHLKLADFGLSTKNIIMSTVAGTKEYIAPEQAKFQTYTNAVDVWSLGVIFDQLLHGDPFYTGENNKQVFEKILKQEYKVRDQSISEPIKLLLVSILKKKAYERPIISVIKARIQQILSDFMRPEVQEPAPPMQALVMKKDDYLKVQEAPAQNGQSGDQSRVVSSVAPTEFKQHKIPIFKYQRKRANHLIKKNTKQEVVKSFMDLDDLVDIVRAERQALRVVAAFKAEDVSFNPNSRVVGVQPVQTQNSQGVPCTRLYQKFTQLKREFDYLNEIYQDQTYEVKLLKTSHSLSQARQALKKQYQESRRQVSTSLLDQINTYIDDLVAKSFS